MKESSSISEEQFETKYVFDNCASAKIKSWLNAQYYRDLDFKVMPNIEIKLVFTINIVCTILKYDTRQSLT